MEIYHVLSRGVDKRKIFLDDQDYFRFIHDLFEFNDYNNVSNSSHHFNKSNDKSIVIARRYIKPRKLLVRIHAFCLMPNHYHFLMSPIMENGISKFMKKINMGYARYFNQRYERIGTLFEGRYKSIIVKNDSHLIHLPYYIHLNPLDLIAPEWRERKLNNYKKTVEFLNSYRWSSYLDYAGKRNFPSLLYKDFLSAILGNTNEFKLSTGKWLKDLDSKDEVFKKLLLE